MPALLPAHAGFQVSLPTKVDKEALSFYFPFAKGNVWLRMIVSAGSSVVMLFLSAPLQRVVHKFMLKKGIEHATASMDVSSYTRISAEVRILCEPFVCLLSPSVDLHPLAHTWGRRWRVGCSPHHPGGSALPGG
jgi:hypothetical protein